MSTIDEHELQAWIDGELAPSDAARVAAAVAADPVLAAQASRERRLRERLRAEFDPVLDEPVPARFAELLGGAASTPVRGGAFAAGRSGRDAIDQGGSSVDSAAATGERKPAAANIVPLTARPRTAMSKARWGTPVYALAASLAVLAVSLWLRPGTGPVQVQDGTLIARGELERGLDQALASEPAAVAQVAIGLSFRDADGRICRSFVHRAQPGLAGLACREGERWSLPVLARPVEGADGELRQASSAMSPEVQAAIDARLQDEVFDAEAERQAREAGWR
ncbi:hypothetical protein ACFFGH_06055 [Lysobacter korlensis]|uniref:Zinc-finger domain-containing protein n=1 Tax=Lysobacter korlensis TaxID=553636 RepID=A0ABV6RKT6_9GAMM